MASSAQAQTAHAARRSLQLQTVSHKVAPRVLVSEAGIDSWNPDIAVRGDSLVVVWEDYHERWGEIYSRRSANGGVSWDPPVRQTFTPGLSVHPRVELGPGGAYLVWQDRSSGNWEALFRQLP